MIFGLQRGVGRPRASEAVVSAWILRFVWCVWTLVRDASPRRRHYRRINSATTTTTTTKCYAQVLHRVYPEERIGACVTEPASRCGVRRTFKWQVGERYRASGVKRRPPFCFFFFSDRYGRTLADAPRRYMYRKCDYRASMYICKVTCPRSGN